MPKFITRFIEWLSRRRAAPEEPVPEPKEIPEEILADEQPEPVRVQRAAIFIDGSNFYNSLKTVTVKNLSPLGVNKVYSLDALKERYLFGRGTQFNFALFVEDLLKGRDCAGKSFYTAIFSFNNQSPELERLIIAKQRFALMLKHKGFTVCEGEIIQNGQKQYEKGVDTLLTMDVVSGAILDTYDVAIIVSSDNDFLPLFKRVKSYNKKVEYIGFDYQYSPQLKNTADHTVLLTSECLEKYLLKK